MSQFAVTTADTSDSPNHFLDFASPSDGSEAL